MKDVVFIKAKSLTLMFTPNPTFLHGKITFLTQVIQQLPKELIKSLVSNLNHLSISRPLQVQSCLSARETFLCIFLECYYTLLNCFGQQVSFSGRKFRFKNAIEIQRWTAPITILFFAVLKQQAAYKWYFSNLVSSLRLNTFTKIDLYQWINSSFTPSPEEE